MEEREPECIDLESRLRKYARAVPFVPYVLVTGDGNQYPIREPFQLAMGGNTIVMMLPGTGIKTIRKNQIAALHLHKADRGN
jgi:hypothetical protein